MGIKFLLVSLPCVPNTCDCDLPLLRRLFWSPRRFSERRTFSIAKADRQIGREIHRAGSQSETEREREGRIDRPLCLWLSWPPILPLPKPSFIAGSVLSNGTSHNCAIAITGPFCLSSSPTAVTCLSFRFRRVQSAAGLAASPLGTARWKTKGGREESPWLERARWSTWLGYGGGTLMEAASYNWEIAFKRTVNRGTMVVERRLWSSREPTALRTMRLRIRGRKNNNSSRRSAHVRLKVLDARNWRE